MAIQLVVFDLGNVMIHLAGGWENAFRLAGIAYRPINFTSEFSAAFTELEDAYERGALADDEYFPQLSALLDGLYTPDELRACYLATIQREMDGIHEIVVKLKAAGYRTACLSNTCALHWPVLTDPAMYPGIAGLHHQHASHLFGLRKPDTDIYRAFEAATGFAGSHILFFDDRPENIAAAREHGWHAVQILPETPSAEQIYAAFREFDVTIG